LTLIVIPLEAPTGARITSVELGTELNDATYGAIHQAWLDHQVVVSPGQTMTEAAHAA
jgi:alpha-ketoglutarate-dependent taurine dioxygenase